MLPSHRAVLLISENFSTGDHITLFLLAKTRSHSTYLRNHASTQHTGTEIVRRRDSRTPTCLHLLHHLPIAIERSCVHDSMAWVIQRHVIAGSVVRVTQVRIGKQITVGIVQVRGLSSTVVVVRRGIN